MPAAYRKAPGFTGGSITPRCQKVGYDSRREALKALKAQRLPGGNALRPYKCNLCTNTWHLGHNREKYINAKIKNAQKRRSA